MNDVEHDLRELFDRKASSVGGVAPRLPERVRKRSRRRELATSLTTILVGLGLIVASAAGVRVAMSRDGSNATLPGESDRAAADVVIASGTDWQLQVFGGSDRPRLAFIRDGSEASGALPIRSVDHGQFGRYGSAALDQGILVYGTVGPGVERVELVTVGGQVVSAVPRHVTDEGARVFALIVGAEVHQGGNGNVPHELTAFGESGGVVDRVKIY